MRLSFHHPWIPDYPDLSIIFNNESRDRNDTPLPVIPACLPTCLPQA